jgi:glutamate formiminotransferase
MRHERRRPLLECVVNVSEGRRRAVVEGIRAAATPAVVLDFHSDRDHNRSVLTLAGEPGPLVDGVVGLARRAVETIDMRSHAGGHPRLGAVDVVPFVALRGATPQDAVAAALSCARRLWEEGGVPSFLYEDAAPATHPVSLPAIRRGAFDSILPDVGGPGPHPSAGAAVVGARPLLVAYNVDLRTPDPAIARRIATKVRERDGGLPHVRALGLLLASRAIAQVSMNLVSPETTTMADAFDAVQQAARAEGTAVLSAELVGLCPWGALGGRSPASLSLVTPPKILEDEIERAFG